jgi:hypothetical protein
MTVGLLSLASNIFADGTSGAPAGTAQFPHLLDLSSGTQTNGRTLAVRPAWNVAGVDFAVGIDRTLYPTDANLKDPTTILSTITGATGNNSTHIVTISGSNVTIDGYDFSGGGGWTVNFTGGSNNTLSNSKFVVGTNNQNPVEIQNTTTNATVIKCDINGNATLNQSTGQGLIGNNGKGKTTVQYNHIRNAYSEPIVMGTNLSADLTQDWDIRFNAIGDAGMGFDGGAHGDWIQTSNATGCATRSMIFDFNLLYQFAGVTSLTTGPRTQGLSFWSAGGNAGLCQNYTCQNNTVMGTGVAPTSNGPYVSTQFIIIPKNLSGNAAIRNNYFDTTLYVVGNGSVGGGAFWLGSDFGAGTASQGAQSGTINGTFPPTNLFTSSAMPAGNTNIVTGALLTTASNNGNVHLATS